MASPWDDICPKIIVSAVDKVLLGGVLLVVGHWLQKQLEVFKRNQALASELAKARIAAYHRALNAVAAFEYTGFLVGAVADEKRSAKNSEELKVKTEGLDKLTEDFNKQDVELSTLLTTERYLLGRTFTLAAVKFAQHVHSVALRVLSDTPPDADERTRFEEERGHLREVLLQCLPRFAKEPEADLHFSSPDFDAIYAKIASRGRPHLKK